MDGIDSLVLECGLIYNDMDKFRGWITEAESRISVVEDNFTSACIIADLQHMVKVLVDRSKDAEN